MGQFKPMVKMMTTEPTVELKLKKGGHVNMKKGGKAEAGHKKMAMGGGAMDMMTGTPALVGRPAVNAPVRAPMKPSMSSRRKAMMAKKPAMAMPPMKEGGESKKTHMAEMSKMKGLEKELKSHESKPASKGHKGLKTGGVALGNAGGYKKGGDVKMAKGGVAGNGIINTEKQGGKYRDTLMHTAEYTGKSNGKTGDVKMGNGGGYKDGGMTMVEKGGKMVPDFAADGKGKMKKGGMMGGGMMGYKTGGVALGNAGGFKAGGKTSKKAYAAGGTVNSGRPVAMPQGAKKPSSPVSIDQLSGTFKKGGKVTPAQGRLMKNFASENKTAMKQAKAQSNEVYSKYGNMKMAEGGSTDMSKGAYDASKKHSRELEDALNPLSMIKELYGKARNAVRGEGSVNDVERNAMQRLMEEGKRSGASSMDAQKLRDAMMKSGRSQRDIDSLMRGQGAITETERSVTVSPAGKKRGGRAC
jgi:hypothetical protein